MSNKKKYKSSHGSWYMINFELQPLFENFIFSRMHYYIIGNELLIRQKIFLLTPHFFPSHPYLFFEFEKYQNYASILLNKI